MSDAASITEWLQQLPIPWLVSGPNGRADVTSYGTVLDGEVALTKLAVKARMPELTPADGLPHIGNERGLIQGGSIAGTAEADADFRRRLKKAWDNAWPYAGTPLAILLQLYYSLGYTDVAIVQQNGVIYTLTTPLGSEDDPLADLVITSAGTLEAPAMPGAGATKTIPIGSAWWRFDDNTDFCSRFAVVITTAPADWTSVVNPPTSSSAPSLNEVNLIRQIIQRWRNAEATCVGIYARLTGKLWGIPASQVWGAATGNWGGTSVVFTP